VWIWGFATEAVHAAAGGDGIATIRPLGVNWETDGVAPGGLSILRMAGSAGSFGSEARDEL